MKRTVSVAIFTTGVVLGCGITALWPERAVQAQTAWQCKSWTLDEKGDAAVIGAWIGPSKAVQLTSSGLSAGSRFAVVACKQ